MLALAGKVRSCEKREDGNRGYIRFFVHRQIDSECHSATLGRDGFFLPQQSDQIASNRLEQDIGSGLPCIDLGICVLRGR